MIPRTVNQRVQELRDRMRALGYVLRQVWVHPDDWERVKKFIDRINKVRDKRPSRVLRK